MRSRLWRFFQRRDAATAVEYAVLLALILLAVFASVVLLGQATNQSLQNSSNSLSTVNSGP